MEVKDNGKAFRVEGKLFAKDKKRLGLLGMQERARLLNGQCAIESAPGKGTDVRVEIPFQNGTAKRLARNGESRDSRSSRGGVKFGKSIFGALKIPCL